MMTSVSFNVISVTRGWVGVKFPGKKRYVALEWPLIEAEDLARIKKRGDRKFATKMGGLCSSSADIVPE